MRQALLWTSVIVATWTPRAEAAANGRVSTFELQPDGTGRVRVYDDVTGALSQSPLELAGLTLLPLEVNGRTHLLEHQADAAGLVSDVPGANRALLPNRRGSLYHFSRVDAQGLTTFGFFLVPPRGAAFLVHELPGIGPGQTSDPFVARIACSPSGDAFLVSTLPAAGGNVLEIRLGPPVQVVDRTANLSPRRFFAHSLLLAETWGTFGLKRAFLRFERQPGAQGAPLSFGAHAVPTSFTGHVVLSRNGAFAATTAGAGPSALDVYVFGPTGPASRATPAPSTLSGAGFLPEAEDGPHLAVSDDGLACAWRTEGASRECWVGRVQAPPTDPATELSSNARFLDTLDEVGVFVFRAPDRLQLGVGAQVAPGVSNLENTDLFQVDVPGTLGGAQFLNLSLSSGDPTLPFFSVPSITLERTALLPTTGDTWYADGDSQGGSVSVAHEGQVRATVVVPAVKTFVDWEFVAGQAWVHVRSDLGNRPYELYRVRQDLTAPAVLIASSDADFTRHALRNDGLVACIGASLASSSLFATNLVTGVTQTLPGHTGPFGPTLTFTPTGAIAFTSVAGGVPSFHVWTPGVGVVPLQVSGAVGGFVLPIGR
ncbi:MAG: hypothetical protein IPJ77_16740 [Planctomycetes bacterium]|nr:hypothetical protein [Planctomycetota bacterium]